MSPLLKNLALALTLALVGWIGYFLFIKDDTDLVSQDAELNQAILDGQQFLMKIQEVDRIRLDGAIHGDTRFRSLFDLSIEPKPEDVGRENPFAPLTAPDSE